MALNPQALGRNFARRAIKAPSLRLSDVAAATTTDFAEVLAGDGAPSGGYGRPAGATLVYFRKDASSVATAVYVTVDGGTNWTAMNPAALSSLDLNGTELILDADADTSITADTDDTIDFRISGADDFQMTANLLSILTGSHVALADSAAIKFGTGLDIIVTWDGSKLAVTQAAPNSAIDFGVDGAGIDIIHRGDTAGAALTWDQSADSLIFSGVAKLKLQTIADPGTGVAIPVTAGGSIAITTAAAETNTLADPTYMGQPLTLFCDTYAVGNRVVTAASRINQAGNTIMTFGAVGDFIKLEAITIGGALKWQVVANDGVALS